MSDGFGRLVEKIKQYDQNCRFDTLEKAYNLSRSAHENQLRVSGAPFITHPVEVALIIAELELDCTTVVAALLHDTVEDTLCTIEKIKSEFGDEVANLVDGVTKLGQIPFTTKEEQQVENLRKMFLAMARDIRVIIIKLADRLHNMRTLKYLDADKQLEKASETMEIYAPIANRLGMTRIKWELEDICLRYIDPQGYYDLVEKIAKKRKEREAYINEIIETLEIRTKEINIPAHIDGRPKHFYSIYKKMKDQNKTLDQIYDLFAVRVIVNTVNDCYSVLGLVHELYKPLPERFKDYIAMPKPNLYQSLHNTLIGKEGTPFEVQIRTWDMHRIAEYGVAAHWKYKEGIKDPTDIDSKLAWLRHLLEWQKEMRDDDEYLENLKVDFFADEVFVFTPKGDVINLPVGSTPVDFAYAIHSAVGNKMMGARANGRIVTLDYELKNGDIVEIITSASVHGPSRDWLKIAKSTQAKNKINQWFKKENRDENVLRGKEAVERELKKQGCSHTQLFKTEFVEPILRRYNFNNVDDMYAAIGYGAITSSRIVTRLKDEFRKTLKPEEIEAQLRQMKEAEEEAQQKSSRRKKNIPESGIVVKGIDNCLVRLSRCCNPVPGDDVTGFITRGRGVSVHRKDCLNVTRKQFPNDRLIDVSWYKAENISYMADISIIANDRIGLLMELTNAIGESKIPLKAINARTTKDQTAVINLTVEITDTDQLDKIIRKIRKVDGVFEVTRNRQ